MNSHNLNLAQILSLNAASLAA